MVSRYPGLYHCQCSRCITHRQGRLAREPSAPSEAHDARPQEGKSDPAPDECHHIRLLLPSFRRQQKGHSFVEGRCCFAHASARRHHSRDKSGMLHLCHSLFVVPSFLSFVSMIHSGTWCRLILASMMIKNLDINKGLLQSTAQQTTGSDIKA